MEIRRLLWLDHSLAKLAEHGVSQAEVQEVIGLDAWVPAIHPEYPGQVRIIGPTRSGRCLTVVMEATDQEDRWRPVTGWTSTRQEREYYTEEHA